MKANREGEFNLPSFLDEQKAVLPADTDLTEEDPGPDEKPEEHAQPLEFQIHRSQPQPAREESEEPDFEREMQEAEEEDAYAGYEDVDIPEMQQILPAKTAAAAKASRGTGKAAISAEIKEDPQPEAEQKASHQPSRNPKSSQTEIEHGIRNIQHEISQGEAPEKKPYQYPPLKLLKRGDGRSQGDSDAHLRKTAQKLQETLHNFGVNVTITNVSCGPTVTRYELQPEMGVKVSKIVGLSDDIKLNLASTGYPYRGTDTGKGSRGDRGPEQGEQRGHAAGSS